eukprot:scaffold5615_cov103-Isochrysis_galbana.AAC.9
MGSRASTRPSSVMRRSAVAPRAPTQRKACCAASSAAAAGGSGKGKARTTTPSTGTRHISGDEKAGKPHAACAAGALVGARLGDPREIVPRGCPALVEGALLVLAGVDHVTNPRDGDGRLGHVGRHDHQPRAVGRRGKDLHLARGRKHRVERQHQQWASGHQVVVLLAARLLVPIAAVLPLVVVLQQFGRRIAALGVASRLPKPPLVLFLLLPDESGRTPQRRRRPARLQARHLLDGPLRRLSRRRHVCRHVHVRTRRAGTPRAAALRAAPLSRAPRRADCPACAPVLAAQLGA